MLHVPRLQQDLLHTWMPDSNWRCSRVHCLTQIHCKILPGRTLHHL